MATADALQARVRFQPAEANPRDRASTGLAALTRPNGELVTSAILNTVAT